MILKWNGKNERHTKKKSSCILNVIAVGGGSGISIETAKTIVS